MKYRIGLVGCGWISSFQIEGWSLIPNTEVVGVCDRDRFKAETLARRFGISWHGDDARLMMEACKIDIADIATTPESHLPLVLEAVNRGIHVLCQKPAAPKLAEAEEMIRAASTRDIVLYINEMLRFCPWFAKIRELLDAKLIGRPVYARFFNRTDGFLEVGPDHEIAYAHRGFLRRTPRVIVLEETIHYFDVLRYLFGDPRSIYAVTGHVSPALEGDDIVTAVMRYPSMIAVIEDSWSAHGPERSGLEIEGTDGAIFLSGLKVVEFYSGRSGRLEQTWNLGGKSWPEQRPHVFADLFRDFLRVIAAGADCVAQARDNLRTLRLTLAAYESAEESKEITL
jgi:predicted dehydrogenase